MLAQTIWSVILRNFELEMVDPMPEANYEGMVRAIGLSSVHHCWHAVASHSLQISSNSVPHFALHIAMTSSLPS